MILNKIICQYADDEDEETDTCWAHIEDVDSMDVEDVEAIFNEYM